MRLLRDRLMPQLTSLLLLASCAGTAWALPSDRQQPVEITANSARFDERAGEAVYKGNVIVRQGTLEVKGDQLTLNVDASGNLTQARTQGNPARFQQLVDPNKGPVRGEAREVLFDNRDGTVTLLGNAILRQDNASFSGPRIVYSTARQQIEASGSDSQRVQLVFPPSVMPADGRKDGGRQKP